MTTENLFDLILELREREGWISANIKIESLDDVTVAEAEIQLDDGKRTYREEAIDGVTLPVVEGEPK